MCNKTCIDFGIAYLSETEVSGKDIIEIGALNVNGSLRPAVVAHKPASYIGVDLAPGPGVDKICRVEELISAFGEKRFDVVISTELLEHVRDWRSAIHNMKTILKGKGVLILTTRSRGAEYHGFPYDFWRFEVSDMEEIFADFEIEVLLSDPLSPGVLMKARKREPSFEVDYRGIALYSILARKRLSADPRVRIATVRIFSAAKPVLSKMLPGFLKTYAKKMLSQITKIQ